MAVCDTCGNDYWLSFEIHTIGGYRHVFDSFECAVQRLAPVCEHCTCRVIGHGVEVDGRFFCSAHCARVVEGLDAAQLRDAVGVRPN